MKNRGPLLVLLGALAALVVGLAVLFQLRLAQGDSFAAYSSLRSDPLGLRVLHDSLAQVPGMRVDRQFKAVQELQPLPARTIVAAGIWPHLWSETTREEFDALDTAVRGGCRLVLGFRAQAAPTEKEKEDREKAEKEIEQRRKEQEEKTGKKTKKPVYMDLRRRWGAELKERVLMEKSDGALRSDDARAAALPESLPWKSDVYFELEDDAGWNVIYRRASRPVLVERKLGRGSIVLVADSYILSNEALQNDRAPTLLAWIVGPFARVSFDEAHLGMREDTGIAALARRYGLASAFFTLVVLAGLFVWRRMALFVPPPDQSEELALTYHPAAGLEALLRRAVPANQLVTTCVTEWKATARDSDRARVDTALADAPKKSSAVALYNIAAQALRRTKDQGQRTKDEGPENKKTAVSNPRSSVPGP